jgi:hypothetical protein
MQSDQIRADKTLAYDFHDGFPVAVYEIYYSFWRPYPQVLTVTKSRGRVKGWKN